MPMPAMDAETFLKLQTQTLIKRPPSDVFSTSLAVIIFTTLSTGCFLIYF